MDKTILLHLGKVSLVTIVVMTAVFTVNYLVLAFAEPGQAPPAGNVSAPLNVGADAQSKSGNLGIGVTGDPLSRLHVKDGQTWGSDLSIDATGLAGGRRWLLISTGGTAGEGQGKFLIKDNNAGAVRLVIDTAGNVGIGTASPGSKLHISSADISSAGPNTDTLLGLEANGDIRLEGIVPRANKFIIAAAYPFLATGYNSIEMYGDTAAGSPSSMAFKTGNQGSGTTATRLIMSAGNFSFQEATTISTTTGNLTLNPTGDVSIPDDIFSASAKGYVAGHTARISIAGENHTVQVHALGPLNLGLAAWRAVDSNGPVLAFGRSRSATIGTMTLVLDGDPLGSIKFAGADGTDMASLAARIDAEVDGAPGANDMPGRLVFSTTADGAVSPTERMRITSGGNVGIGTAAPLSKTQIDLAGVTGASKALLSTFGSGGRIVLSNTAGGSTDSEVGIFSTAAGGGDGLASGIGFAREDGTNWGMQLRFYVRPTATVSTDTITEAMRITAAGNVGIGTTSPGAKLEVAGQVKITGGSPGLGKVLTSDAAGLATWNPPSAGLGGSGTATQVAFFTAANTIGSDSGLYWDNTNKRLGIGTAGPGYKLDVTGDIHLSGILYLSQEDYNSRIITDFTWSIGEASENIVLHTWSADLGDYLLLRGSAGQEEFTISDTKGFLFENGNVGIGMTSPASRLHIKGGQQWGSDLSIDATGLSPAGSRWLLISTGGTASEGAGKFLIKDNNAGAVRLAIDTAGNVSITNKLKLGQAEIYWDAANGRLVIKVNP